MGTMLLWFGWVGVRVRVFVSVFDYVCVYV